MEAVGGGAWGRGRSRGRWSVWGVWSSTAAACEQETSVGHARTLPHVVGALQVIRSALVRVGESGGEWDVGEVLTALTNYRFSIVSPQTSNVERPAGAQFAPNSALLPQFN